MANKFQTGMHVEKDLKKAQFYYGIAMEQEVPEGTMPFYSAYKKNFGLQLFSNLAHFTKMDIAPLWIEKFNVLLKKI